MKKIRADLANHLVQNILSSNLLSKNVKIKFINKNVSCGRRGCETWTLMLREEHWIRVFEKKALRKISGPKREEVKWGWTKNFTICTSHQIFV
jgi:hypothetical protein